MREGNVTMSEQVEVTLCEACITTDAYGAPFDEEPDAEPLAKLQGWLIGSLPCEHGYDCNGCDSPSTQAHFGSHCSGCDTQLAGERYDYVAVPQQERV